MAYPSGIRSISGLQLVGPSSRISRSLAAESPAASRAGLRRFTLISLAALLLPAAQASAANKGLLLPQQPRDWQYVPFNQAAPWTPPIGFGPAYSRVPGHAIGHTAPGFSDRWTVSTPAASTSAGTRLFSPDREKSLDPVRDRSAILSFAADSAACGRASADSAARATYTPYNANFNTAFSSANPGLRAPAAGSYSEFAARPVASSRAADEACPFAGSAMHPAAVQDWSLEALDDVVPEPSFFASPAALGAGQTSNDLIPPSLPSSDFSAPDTRWNHVAASRLRRNLSAIASHLQRTKHPTVATPSPSNADAVRASLAPRFWDE